MKVKDWQNSNYYRRKAFSQLPKWCEKCKGVAPLEIHHKDGNRANNEIENLQILCKTCHRVVHGFGEPRKYMQQKGNPKFMKGTKRRKKKK